MIYLDSAATSYPKPEAVIERVTYALREFGSPGRSSHRLSMIADREVFACRVAAAEMFGTTPERVIFTQNTTMALNMAMKTAYRSGGIVISDLEHNSIRRPALALTDNVRIFDSHIELSDGRTAAILESIKRKCRGAKLLISTAASNTSASVSAKARRTDAPVSTAPMGLRKASSAASCFGVVSSGSRSRYRCA